LTDDVDRFSQRHFRVATEDGAQIFALQKLHHQEGAAVVGGAGIENVDDVRAFDGARGFGLTAGPPLLRDGLVRFKKRWGAQALPGARHGTAFAMRVHHGTPELAAVLEQKPLIGLSWESAAPRLCAPVPRLAHQPRVHSSPLPGVLVRELELAVAEELPERWDAYARAAAAY